jgi:hypothetical protein
MAADPLSVDTPKTPDFGGNGWDSYAKGNPSSSKNLSIPGGLITSPTLALGYVHLRLSRVGAIYYAATPLYEARSVGSFFDTKPCSGFVFLACPFEGIVDQATHRRFKMTPQERTSSRDVRPSSWIGTPAPSPRPIQRNPQPRCFPRAPVLRYARLCVRVD